MSKRSVLRKYHFISAGVMEPSVLEAKADQSGWRQLWLELGFSVVVMRVLQMSRTRATFSKMFHYQNVNRKLYLIPSTALCKFSNKKQHKAMKYKSSVKKILSIYIRKQTAN